MTGILTKAIISAIILAAGGQATLLDNADIMTSKALLQEAKTGLYAEQQALLAAPHLTITIEYTGVETDEGAMFYDGEALYEPDIFVDWATLDHWGFNDFEPGDTVDGIFDEDGWELLGFVKFYD